jgi:hypothetical protein
MIWNGEQKGNSRAAIDIPMQRITTDCVRYIWRQQEAHSCCEILGSHGGEYEV